MFYFTSHPLIIRKIPVLNSEVYLTFDDGPSSDLTEKILDVLEQENAKASFFVIGQRAIAHPEVIRRILADGHAIFSHSIDHDYKHFLQNKFHLEVWLEKSLSHLEEAFGIRSNIFRPPAGVLTPALVEVAEKLHLRLILWTHRYFDTALPWTLRAANRSLEKIVSGDIILLHDYQKKSQHDEFLITLRHFICSLHRKNFVCAILR